MAHAPDCGVGASALDAALQVPDSTVQAIALQGPDATVQVIALQVPGATVRTTAASLIHTDFHGFRVSHGLMATRSKIEFWNALALEVVLPSFRHPDTASKGQGNANAVAKCNFADNCVPKCNLGTRGGTRLVKL